MRKKRTIVIGIASFDDVIKDTLEACKKAKRGQPSGPVDQIDFPDEATMWSTLSPKRMEILRYLRKHGPMSGRQLAKALDRDQKNIYTDIKVLSRLDLLKVNDDDKYFVPWDDITIQLALAA